MKILKLSISTCILNRIFASRTMEYHRGTLTRQTICGIYKDKRDMSHREPDVSHCRWKART